jgi:hypothetical protein
MNAKRINDHKIVVLNKNAYCFAEIWFLNIDPGFSVLTLISKCKLKLWQRGHRKTSLLRFPPRILGKHAVVLIDLICIACVTFSEK